MNTRLIALIALVALLGILSLLLYVRSDRTSKGDPKLPAKLNASRDVDASDQHDGSVAEKNADSVPSNPGVRDTKRAGTLIVRVNISEANSRHDLKVLIVDDQTGKIDARDELQGDSLVAEFRDVPVGTKVVVVLPQSGGLAPSYVSSSVTEHSATELTINLLAGLAVSGVVVDRSGNPVADAEVTASLKLGYTLPEDVNRPFYGVVSTSTDGSGWSFFSSGHVLLDAKSAKDGRFTIPNVGWGPVKLTAKKGNVKSTDQWANPGDEVRLVLPQR